MKALTYSASLLPEDQQEEPTKFDLWLEKRLGSEKAEKIVIGCAAVLGVLLALALFIFLPTLIAGLIPGLEGRYTLRSLIEGAMKIVIFLVYLGLVAQMKEIKRLFSYHGAEHKTIFCYEKGLPLTVENVRPQSRFHPRCGTSFLLVVIILGLLAGLLIQVDNTLLRIALRLLLLPVIIALAYELNRWAGRHETNIVSRIVTWPGKQLQRLTTERARRRHDRVRHPRHGAGDTRGKGQGRLVKCREAAFHPARSANFTCCANFTRAKQISRGRRPVLSGGRESCRADTANFISPCATPCALQGVEAANVEARLLVAAASGKTTAQLLRDMSLYDTDEVENRAADMLRRRLAGEPAAYITGVWEFRGLPMEVSPEVLIPRADTEVLAEEAIRLSRGRTPRRARARPLLRLGLHRPRHSRRPAQGARPCSRTSAPRP